MSEKKAWQTALEKKAKESGFSFETLKKVYERGERVAEKDETDIDNKYAFAMGRVNDFIAGKIDKDLRESFVSFREFLSRQQGQ